MFSPFLWLACEGGQSLPTTSDSRHVKGGGTEPDTPAPTLPCCTCTGLTVLPLSTDTEDSSRAFVDGHNPETRVPQHNLGAAQRGQPPDGVRAPFARVYEARLAAASCLFSRGKPAKSEHDVGRPPADRAPPPNWGVPKKKGCLGEAEGGRRGRLRTGECPLWRAVARCGPLLPSGARALLSLVAVRFLLSPGPCRRFLSFLLWLLLLLLLLVIIIATTTHIKKSVRNTRAQRPVQSSPAGVAAGRKARRGSAPPHGTHFQRRASAARARGPTK